MKAAALLLLSLAALAASAQTVDVDRRLMGSGEPGALGRSERAVQVTNDLWHAPQYLPGFPTAATIWPRVVEVQCDRGPAGLRCDGYDWHPDLGRGEYLFVRPVVKAPAAPAERVLHLTEKVVPVIVERKVFVEVPPKRNRE